MLASSWLLWLAVVRCAIFYDQFLDWGFPLGWLLNCFRGELASCWFASWNGWFPLLQLFDDALVVNLHVISLQPLLAQVSWLQRFFITESNRWNSGDSYSNLEWKSWKAKSWNQSWMVADVITAALLLQWTNLMHWLYKKSDQKLQPEWS